MVELTYPKYRRGLSSTAREALYDRCRNEVVTPQHAKAGRIRRNFIGASVSDCPLPGGRNDSIKRTMSGRVVKR